MGTIDKLVCFFIALTIKLVNKKRLLILNYHSVLDKPDPFLAGDVDKNTFSWQMELVHRYFKPYTLYDAAQKLYSGKLPLNAVVVTFDDGYKDNVGTALKLLNTYQVPATFFIATGFLNGGVMWNDRIIHLVKNTKKQRLDLSEIKLGVFELNNQEQKLQAIRTIIQSLKYKQYASRLEEIKLIAQLCDVDEALFNSTSEPLMMNDADIITLDRAGMEIGAHTVNHPILMCEQDGVVMDEVKKGKQYLEKLLNKPVRTFAYPNGKLDEDYALRHAKMIQSAGLEYAVTTNWGLNDTSTSPYELYRFTPWDKTPVRFLLRLLKLYLKNSV